MAKFKYFEKKDAAKFLGYIKANPTGHAQYNAGKGVLLQYSAGLWQKQEGDKIYHVIESVGWVEYQWH